MIIMNLKGEVVFPVYIQMETKRLTLIMYGAKAVEVKNFQKNKL